MKLWRCCVQCECVQVLQRAHGVGVAICLRSIQYWEGIAGGIGAGDEMGNLDVSIFWRPVGGRIGRGGRIGAKV